MNADTLTAVLDRLPPHASERDRRMRRALRAARDTLAAGGTEAQALAAAVPAGFFLHPYSTPADPVANPPQKRQEGSKGGRNGR